ncbi:TPA: hypothetical protein DEO28_00860 [Candidatus Dependentiae bacterium]|nr:MAG: hypothetical protein UR14_C0003G0024 [candidate division TM6 bacterium GW2011_GWE2_31_21]KKP54144.1 MAG: hypothetical protein UR43_C0001G0162 [candidate division TM6 bacterium GW2011_GWF2_33_332]HBS47865.1 hypothetical protein [Candidatus Dependentiae bacterium]HBZ73050.1 hypothetical protein [Candidatus Dependentiae bacterium]
MSLNITKFAFSIGITAIPLRFCMDFFNWLTTPQVQPKIQLIEVNSNGYPMLGMVFDIFDSSKYQYWGIAFNYSLIIKLFFYIFLIFIIGYSLAMFFACIYNTLIATDKPNQ